MLATRVLLIFLLSVVINGYPHEEPDEDQSPVENQDEQAPHHTTRTRRHEGKNHNKRHKRYFLNQIGYAPPQNAEYSNPNYGYYPSPPVIGFCPPWPSQKQEQCPEKQILKDLIKAMQNPPSIRVICGADKTTVTPAIPDVPNRGNFVDDDKVDLSTLERERNWGVVDQYPEPTPEEQAQYGSREIELNPYFPSTSAPKLSKNSRKVEQSKSNPDRCDFVYTACCNDDATVENCYKKNGCEKTYREGNSCVELPKEQLHRYIKKTFRYSNGN